MTDRTVTLEFLAQPSQNMLDEMRALRRELADVRSLSLQNHDYDRRLDRRMSELKDDLEVMPKAELMGRMGHMETKIENYLQPITDKLRNLEDRVAVIDHAGR